MNTDTGLQVRLEAVNVPASLPHAARNEELEQIPDYVRAVPEAPGTLCLVNFGTATPGVDCRPYPWIKVDGNGYFAGVWVWRETGSAWVEAAPAP